jgi:catechol 2,3-dioxygenase-like lactoylglutathione lyase family enzyme
MLLENNLLGVENVGIPAMEIRQSARWYTEKLGFKDLRKTMFTSPENGTKFALLGRDGLTLELRQPTGEDFEQLRALKDGHIDHFAMDVLDVRRGIKDLLALGGQIDPDTKDGPVALDTVFAKGVQYVFFRGPANERFELNERNDLDRSRRTENLGGWSHLGIPVTSIDNSVEFYQRFGFKTLMEAGVPVGDGREVKITIVERGGLNLEFYQLLEEALPEIRSRTDGRVDHVAISVREIDEAFAELKSAGIQPLEEEPISMPYWDDEIKYFTFRGPDGEKIQLQQTIR